MAGTAPDPPTEPSAPDGHRPAPGDRAILVRLAALAACSVVALALLAWATAPSWTESRAEESRPSGVRALVASVGGQRWNFFTRDATAPNLQALVRADDGWSPVHAGAADTTLRSLRLDRRGRVYRGELHLLARRAHDAGQDWTTCPGSPVDCAGDAPALTVANPTPAPRLCGDVVLVRSAAPRWAERDRTDPDQQVLRLDVRC